VIAADEMVVNALLKAGNDQNKMKVVESNGYYMTYYGDNAQQLLASDQFLSCKVVHS
jgi:hypothetical protein